jgi:cytochrome c553
MTSFAVDHLMNQKLLLLLALLFATTSVGTSAATPLAAQPNPVTEKRMQACTTCHGSASVLTSSKANANANKDYIPRIAGKPSGYLLNQLVNFREGRREYKSMVKLVEHLSDNYLMEMAAYFEQQQLPYDAPDVKRDSLSAVTLARGEQLALRGDVSKNIPSCVSCHGAALTGVQPAIPGLVGLPRFYLLAQLGAWQNGQRKAHAPDCMARIAKALTGEDAAAVTAWLAVQPIPSPASPLAKLPNAMPESCGGLQ